MLFFLHVGNEERHATLEIPQLENIFGMIGQKFAVNIDKLTMLKNGNLIAVCLSIES